MVVEKDKMLVVNSGIIIWPTDNLCYFLADNSRDLSYDLRLSPDALAFLKRFVSPLRFSDLKINDKRYENMFSEAVEAGLIVEYRINSIQEHEAFFDGFRFIDWKFSPLSLEEIKERISRKETDGGRSIIVIDGLLSSGRVRTAARWLSGLSYRLADYDTDETPEIRHWIHEFQSPRDVATAVPFLSDLVTVARELFPEGYLVLQRLHANASIYGDLQLPHRDIEDEPGVTLLYYGNDYWEPKWMGETIFYDNKGESLYALLPKPGRIVVFHGDILHRAGVPSRLCLGSRWTLSMKFSVSKT